VKPLLGQILLLLLLALIPAAVLAQFHPHRPLWHKPSPKGEVSIQQVEQWPTSAVLWLDARSQEQYQLDHVPGALSLNEDQWEENLAQVVTAWQPGLKVVVYCDSNSCDASHQVATRLEREMGWSDVYVLQGGWRTWQQSHR
jgi:3-mercaptopyruvate sulfurtransferase SseA